jgi:hypothetical protein
VKYELTTSSDSIPTDFLAGRLGKFLSTADWSVLTAIACMEAFLSVFRGMVSRNKRRKLSAFFRLVMVSETSKALRGK